MQGATLRLLNSRTDRLEEFSPIDTEGPVRMYSCGPTVYSRAHLGNLRAYLFADTARRVLRWKGYDVAHVVNITDVGHLLADADLGDDKVEEAAKREHRSVWDLTNHYTRLFLDDLEKLAVLPPDRWTKASEYIPQMIAFARRLEELGHTYVLPSGLYFDTTTIDHYGEMSHIDHTRLRERVDMVEGKRHPTDFAIWRTYPRDQPARAMEWESPWGPGAPGWHLECSVMSIDALGPHFDIHTGGVDHREVHHPNEDAQSRAYLHDDRQWVRYWLHNEYARFGGEKMSKSTGNVLTIDDVERIGVHPLGFRLLMLASHYRAQTLVTLDDIEAAGRRLGRLAEAAVSRLPETAPAAREEGAATYDDVAARMSGRARRYLDVADSALSDDLGTPRALAALSEALRDPELSADDVVAVVDVVGATLGLDLAAVAQARVVQRDRADADVDPTAKREIGDLVAARDRARADRDFAAADAIRERLAERFGVVLVDGADGTTWSVRAP